VMQTLEYASPDTGTPGSRLTKFTYIMTATSALCFGLPFLLFYLSNLAHPGNAEAAGFAVLIPAILLWLASGVCGLAGVITGCMAFLRGSPMVLTLICICINAVPTGVVTYSICR
jgi:hypothetical protein